jgi:glutathione S-transferase
LGKKFSYVNSQLNGKEFILGNSFSAADAYLFTVISWTGFLKIDLKPWPNLVSYLERLRSRPSVKDAMKAEGL